MTTLGTIVGALVLAWFIVVGVRAEERRASSPPAACGHAGESKAQRCVELSFVPGRP